MRIAFIAFLSLYSSTALAYTAQHIEPAQPFDPVLIADVTEQHTVLGELDGYPEMVEFSVDSTITIPVTLKQPIDDEVEPFGLIVVRVNGDSKSVTEIERVTSASIAWEEVSDDTVGVSYVTSPTYEVDLVPGLYRLEVSTPVNYGRYALTFGEGESGGYFASLASIYRTQSHFGFSPVSLLRSPYVHYPIGIMIVVAGLLLTWRYRSKFSHDR